jgi:DNA polymerase-3 subunit alpha
LGVVRAEPRSRKSSGSAGASPFQAGVIRFGLCAVRGVGAKAVEAIIEERAARGPFTGLFDFCERVDMRTVQRSTIEALTKCGAFSAISAKRAPLLHALDRAVEMGQQSQQDKRAGQLNMFGGAAASVTARMPAPPLPDVPEFAGADLLKFEKELLGFYITSHPLTEHQSAIERYTTATTKDCMTLGEGVEVTLGGMITRVKKSVTKNGRSAGMPMAMITIEDLEGQIDGVLFADVFADSAKRYPGAIENESIVFLKGRIDRRRETPSIVVTDVIPVAESIAKLTTGIAIKLEDSRHNAELVPQLKPLLQNFAGNCRIFLQVTTNDSKKVVLQLNRELSVRPAQALVDDLERMLGAGSVQLVGEGSRRQKRVEQQRLFKEDVAPVEPDTAGASMDPLAEEVAADLDPAE